DHYDGSVLLIAYVFPMLVLALALVYLTRLAPSAGGIFTFASRFLHSDAGTILGWAYVVMAATVTPMTAVIGAEYIAQMLPKGTHDYARFIRSDQVKVGTFFVGFGPQLVAFFISGLIGIWFGVRYNEPNPGIFFVSALGVWGAIFAILTQLRINVTNLYSGSLSLSNFFEHVFRFTPGRVFWVVFTAVVAIIGMLLGALNYTGPLLTFQGVFLFVWVSSLIADVVLVKRVLRIGPSYIEHRAERLYTWNPVGAVSLIVSCVIGSMMAFGVFGSFWQSIAAFAAGVLEIILYTILAIATGGRYYLRSDGGEVQVGAAKATPVIPPWVC
ncbi:MAG: hypothetical protein K6T30_10470, partial [Alicyclobacillus sp.]|nr:hypothetical protein [Alicyclobacillus sp.]